MQNNVRLTLLCKIGGVEFDFEKQPLFGCYRQPYFNVCMGRCNYCNLKLLVYECSISGPVLSISSTTNSTAFIDAHKLAELHPKTITIYLDLNILIVSHIQFHIAN